ncbi:MAG: GNAT family N-acetyltransferase [Candidatus Bathyarchaeota archaeon]|nr:GNAT family N-acetyltransferase [Candidatus Bathyarchaeota archaeon]
MVYPFEWETTFTAKNGAKIHFRPEVASDTEMLWEMFSTLSEQTVSFLIPPLSRERIAGWTSNINYNAILPIMGLPQGEDRIIASATLQFNSMEALQHKGCLAITVHDDYQNIGIGTALLQHLIGVAKSRGLKKVWLTVNVDNERALNLYRKLGFEVEGTLRKETYYEGRYTDEFRMALFL